MFDPLLKPTWQGSSNEKSKHLFVLKVKEKEKRKIIPIFPLNLVHQLP